MSNLQVIVDSSTLQHVFTLGLLSFITAMILTPIYTTAAYRGQWWKKIRTHSISGEAAKVFHKLHAAKHERNIPTMAGIIFISATAIITIGGNLTRSETWLPLAAMVGAGAVGLIDDVINIRGIGGKVSGLRAKVKGSMIIGIAAIGGWWFYEKLGVSTLHIPFGGDLSVGWLIIPIFVLVVFSSAISVNFTDGLDGLAGGLSAIAFGAYAIIAIIQEQYGVAGFCMTLVGALLSYTWFNIYPARFFMGDVGSFALGTALGVVAMLTDTLLLLPLIGFVFVAETGSVIVQLVSKSLEAGRKCFDQRRFIITLRLLVGPKPK